MAHKILINYPLSASLAADIAMANHLLVQLLGEIQNLHMQNKDTLGVALLAIFCAPATTLMHNLLASTLSLSMMQSYKRKLHSMWTKLRYTRSRRTVEFMDLTLISITYIIRVEKSFQTGLTRSQEKFDRLKRTASRGSEIIPIKSREVQPAESSSRP